ncbi:L-aspartate oxidase [Alicyclobacillus fastidiosus]|uniref:L-aspartate oxidase n=1 Tax=Alicyclobacillus fastidiosus TaxID=392011 RepID=A0ABY6ZFB0_9BACL|nr:L-aspartate oxidase [Alicyclobacillus fastidiosus]WAH40796.1 L-aspartate oxidase [Alicyclobacillus fastidiosus]GMA62277.1 L-aspartate oxidase [Alicyclobacillus fastidiosus]
MEILEADFVIIGSGLAGSVAAYLLSHQGEVLLVSKEPPTKSNSFCAQGGIAAAIHPEDAPTLHGADTLHAGVELCDPQVVTRLTEQAPKLVRWLAEIGVPFDRRPTGEFALGLEGAHSRRRILHAGGDATGRKVMETLTDALSQLKNVRRVTNVHISGLLQNHKRSVIGALGRREGDPSHITQLVARRGTVLATGGAGQLFERTTNPAGATGDGIALAYTAGARLRNLEFVQFHPTALDHGDSQCFLISEAVRGVGAVLVDAEGKPIMGDYPLRDLEPRDVVARAMYSYTQRNQSVYLDCRGIQDFAEKFPTIYHHCRSRGLNPAVDWLPVSPAAHFMMGGIVASMDGRTSVQGLYALGEVAATGVHGANRLASNSLLECLAMAFSLADHMRSTKTEPAGDCTIAKPTLPDVSPAGSEPLHIVQSVMWQAAGIIRDEDSLKRGLAALNELRQEYRNSLTVCAASLLIQSALLREESRGAHYRRDFPRLDPRLNEVDTVISLERTGRRSWQFEHVGLVQV